MKTVLLLVALFLCKIITAQTPESLLQEVQQKYSPEKIYIHYDKAKYIAGETIWFKAYLMDGLLPSTKSTVLCIELLDDSLKILQKKMLPIDGSTAVGEFEIPKNLKQGSYTVRAFTRYLMNFGFEKYYYQSVDIYNPTSQLQNENSERVSSVYFLPEGGNLINNTKNIIAFKCTDNHGYPLSVEGKIVDMTGKEISTFKSSFNGMGKFEIIPKPLEHYFAECIIDNIKKQRIELPISIQEGVVLKITKDKEKAFFNIDATTVNDETLKPYYILGVQENTVVFKSILQPGSKTTSGEIPVKLLPTGILQITVFNKNNQPLAERLTFVNSGDYLPAGQFSTPLLNLSRRGKNQYVFNFEDTVAGSFSVAVTDEDPNKKQDNIVSRFLLTNDLKGYVHNAPYYFESNDTEHRENLDLVMLTNGWRKYSWSEILSNRFPSMSFKDPQYISVNGKVFDPSTGKPILNSELFIIVKIKDNKNDFLVTESDNDGNIFMGGMNFEDTASFIFQSKTTKDRKVNTIFNTQSLSNIFYSVKTPTPKLNFEIPDENWKSKILKGYNFNRLTKDNGILMDEIKVMAKIKSDKEKYEKKYVSGRLGSSASQEIDFLSDPTTSQSNVLEYLKSRVNGVYVSGGPFEYFINYRNTRSLSGGPLPMNIFLDENQVDANQVSSIRIQDVALIKVFSNGGISGGAGGSIAIYTKRAQDGTFRNSPQKNYFIEGFTPTKKFFSPDYENDNDIKDDERSTLYWDPYIITSSKNKSIIIPFFNSDNAKKLKVTIEGFLEDGKLLHVEKMIE